MGDSPVWPKTTTMLHADTRADLPLGKFAYCVMGENLIIYRSVKFWRR